MRARGSSSPSPRPSRGEGRGEGLFRRDSVRRPGVRYDDVIGRIPIAVLVDAVVKAVSIIKIRLCELNWAICRYFHGTSVSTRQLFVRLDFSRWQAACAHSNHLVIVHFRDDRVAADFSDLVFSILMKLGPEKVVTVVVMGIFGQRESGGHEHARANDKLHNGPAIEHICLSISSDSHEPGYDANHFV